MKHAIRLTLTLVALGLLVSCGSTILAVAPKLPRPSAVLTQECDKPVWLEETTLTQADVESYWLTDRSALIACGQRHKALAGWYQARDTALGKGR